MYVQNVTILGKIEKIRSFSRKIINLLSFHIFDYLAEICVEYLNSKFVAIINKGTVQNTDKH